MYVSDKALVGLAPYAARRTAFRLDVGPFVLLYLGVYLGIWNFDPKDGWGQAVVLVVLPGVLVCHLLVFLSTQWSIRFMCLVSQRRVASIDLAEVGTLKGVFCCALCSCCVMGEVGLNRKDESRLRPRRTRDLAALCVCLSLFPSAVYEGCVQRRRGMSWLHLMKAVVSVHLCSSTLHDCQLRCTKAQPPPSFWRNHGSDASSVPCAWHV